MPYLHEVYRPNSDQYDIVHSYETTRASGLVVPRQIARTTIINIAPVTLSNDSALILPNFFQITEYGTPLPDGLLPVEEVPCETIDQFRDTAVEKIYTIYKALTLAAIRLETAADLLDNEGAAIDAIQHQLGRIVNGAEPSARPGSTGFYL